MSISASLKKYQVELHILKRINKKRWRIFWRQVQNEYYCTVNQKAVECGLIFAAIDSLEYVKKRMTKEWE